MPRRLAARRPGRARVPLLRAPGPLPRVLEPQEASALPGALRTGGGRAMVEAMLLGLAPLRLRGAGLRPEGLEPEKPRKGGNPAQSNSDGLRAAMTAKLKRELPWV